MCVCVCVCCVCVCVCVYVFVRICVYEAKSPCLLNGSLTIVLRICAERPYVCSFPNCDRRFADPTNVKRHILSHTGTRVLAC